MTKDELLANIRRDRALLDALVARLDEEQIVEPALDDGWSVKDVLAHIAAWERLCTSWLAAIARGETPARPEVQDVNGTNARFYEQARATPLADVVAESARSYRSIMEAVERLPAADLADEKHFGWPTARVVSGNTDDHYREHIEQIESWLRGAGAVNPAPNAIFFDMDGTILDWTTGMEESWLASCAEHGGGLRTPAQLHDAIRLRRTWFWADPDRSYRGRMDLDGASREVVRHAFADLGLDAVERAHRLADHYRALRAAAIAPYPGAIETLGAIHSRGIAMALITNGEARNQRRSIETHALAHYFRCIVIEGEFGVGKPDERVFQHALTALGCEPEAAWMVGDNLEADIETPYRLGMHTVWVDAEGRGLPDGAETQPHRIVRSITELV